MPQYFFHTRIGDHVISDPDGQQLADPDAAWTMARALARNILQDAAAATPELLRGGIEVADADGEIVLEFPFSEALAD